MDRQLLVFTDLDGTLLDHHDYSYTAAKPALARLARHQIPLVLNSSKTRPEMEALKQSLHNAAPFIVENGAALIIPPHQLGNNEEEVVNFAAPLDAVLSQLHLLRDAGFQFVGFSDMNPAQVAEVTGLSIEAATNAKQRIATEPLLWQGNEEQLLPFQQQLQQQGLQLIKGGRFYHAMGQYDKADAMNYLVGRYASFMPDKHVISIALGDSPNDLRMLENADYAVIIHGVNSDKLTLTKREHVLRSQGRGPVGWNECMQSILNELLDN
jgi:mannosyl-3-phosphoglycerate phosphatase